jgi:hypothetical protein
MVPSMPCAEGTAPADMRPISPQITSSWIGFCAKPAPKARTEKRKKLPINLMVVSAWVISATWVNTHIDRFPNKSASLPKKRRKDPAASEEAADSHVISALVMPRSRPTKDDITVMTPPAMLLSPTAMVQVTTNNTSCSVDLKQAGRAPYLCSASGSGARWGELTMGERLLMISWTLLCSVELDLLMVASVDCDRELETKIWCSMERRGSGKSLTLRKHAERSEYVVQAIRHLQAVRDHPARW